MISNPSRRTALAGGLTLALAPGIGLSSPAPDKIMIIRHREKPNEKSANPACRTGYLDDRFLRPDPAGLTRQGIKNAAALVPFFAKPVAPIEVPRTIFATAPARDSDREQLTVAPLVAYFRANHEPVKYINNIPIKAEKELFKQAVSAAMPVLICWHHTRIRHIAARFKVTNPPTNGWSWNDADFSSIWVFTRDGSGWRFSTANEGITDPDHCWGDA
jgi:hypothetical protein